jgi:hypothetical protein
MTGHIAHYATCATQLPVKLHNVVNIRRLNLLQNYFDLLTSLLFNLSKMI